MLPRGNVLSYLTQSNRLQVSPNNSKVQPFHPSHLVTNPRPDLDPQPLRCLPSANDTGPGCVALEKGPGDIPRPQQRVTRKGRGATLPLLGLPHFRLGPHSPGLIHHPVRCFEVFQGSVDVSIDILRYIPNYHGEENMK